MSSGGKVRLGDIAKVNPKASKSASDRDLVSFLPLASVHTNGTTELGTTFERGEVKKGHPYFMCGDILVAKITPSFENGKIAIADCEMADGYSSTEFHVVRPDTSRVDPFYLLAYLRSPKVRTFCSQRMKGSAGQRRVPKEVLSGLTLSLPAMDVQNERAAKLRRIASLIRSENQQIAQLDQLVKSRFVEMFGDPNHGGSKWPRERLDAFTQVITGNTPSRKIPEYYGEGIEWVKTDNIADSAVTQATECLTGAGRLKARVAPAGSILMACIAGSVKSIGKVGLLDREVAFNQQINAIIPGEAVDSRYLLVLLTLSKDYLCSSINMQLKGILNKSTLSAKEFPLPPLALQQDFAAFAAQVDKTRAIAQQQIDKLQTLYDSLAQEHFA